MNIKNYKVSNTNWTVRDGVMTKNAVRVYRDKIKIAEVFPTTTNPLGYLKNHPGSKYRSSLIKQLRKNDVEEWVIAAILS